ITRIDRSAGLGCRYIVAPIHLVQSRGGPLGSPRGGIWGMNTSTTPHTPLETVLLFRGIAQYGLDEHDFARIAEALQSNRLVKNSPTYDARRLSPETLRALFLRLVRDELRTEGNTPSDNDGALSPASKKRRLQSPPPVTLNDVRQNAEKIETAHTKALHAYVLQATHEIRQFEQHYAQLQKEIRELEKLGVREPDGEPKPQSPNGVPAAGKLEAGPSNGVGPSPGTSPRPPHVPAAQPAPQHPLRNLQPLLPQPAPHQDTRNGPSPLQLATSEKASHATWSPAPAHPEAVRSPQLGQQEVPKTPVTRPAATPKPLNGAPPVLQAPQGAPPFQPPPQSPAPPAVAEGLQRPEGIVGRQSPALQPANAQLPAQGQLKWEPPYQPNAPPRQTANTVPQHPPNMLPPTSHLMPSPRAPQQPLPHPSPVPPQGQAGRPVPQQQVLIPPHSTSQFAPPLQSPTVRSPADLAAGPNRQQPLLPSPAASSVPPPQPPYHPQYQGHPVSTTGPATPVYPGQAAAHPAPAPPGPRRSPAIPPTPTPPVVVPPRPSPGLAAPQHPQQPPAIQPPPYGQQHVPRGAPSPVPAHPDAAQRYSSPYQPPRPAAVDRIHPRPPVTSTPTPAARFSPAPPPPKTPAMTLPPRLAGGSGTKWVSNSTPSTPKPGIEFRLGYDDVPSPAYEPTSPNLLPSAPSVAKEAQRRQGPAETPKHKPGRPHVPQRAQGVSTPQPGPRPASSQPAGPQTKQPAVEREPPRVKHEATTPRPSTEAGDTTADESDLTPTPMQTPRASQLRDALPEGLNPADGPKLVLWTRSFNKVCGSAMEQIVHHRSANMFAAPIREKDAPGYHKVVKQAQDLKTIRAAINHGNRAASHAASSLLEGGDPGSSSVWLPRTEDLVPPRSIINSSQLDRELAHMFSNAVMYNPDPHHGPGPAFVRGDVDDEDGEGGADAAGGGGGGGGAAGAGQQDSGVLGYKVDEFGVVNDARAMFVEVEKLLSELRSAEVRRGAPPPGIAGGVTGTSTRQVSVLGGNGGGGGGADEGEEGEEGDGEGTVKRRRVGRG
ncbi:hypothetical protein C8A01DRAFT_17735, partial [Parachaetomium inaequale]